ncbi:hypothetical protein [Actinoplanes auranticolor]|uniref:Uncharacterized protein n=1 Tax=Actinoplanes auranticolor TaxID=47988 RepID=A0A919SE49_9ACTN|nr:hypothetical protein [Actinoplanes auranticolor]GIM69992.1 hypothetical protein Aau02nite_38910 [Actinoplanes auranticolor]
MSSRKPAAGRPAYLLGAAAGNQLVNLSGATTPYRWLTVALLVAGLTATISRARPRPVAVLVPLALALIAASAALRPAWQIPAGVAAAVLVVAAVGRLAPGAGGATLLAGVTGAGLGTALLRAGVAAWPGGPAVTCASIIGIGVAVIVAGVALLRSNALLLGVAVGGSGLAALAGGFAIVGAQGTAGTMAILGGGLALVTAVLAFVRDFSLLGLAALGDAIAVTGLAMWALRAGEVPAGVTAFAAASAALALGLSYLGASWAD